MNKHPLETLYNSLKRDNYDVPDTYESFARTLINDTNARRTLYNSLMRDNYDVPDNYDSFNNTLFGQYTTREANIAAGVDEASVKARTAQQPRKTRYDVAQEQYEQGRQQTNATPISQTAMGQMGGYGISPTGIPVRNTQGYPMEHPQPQAPAKPMAPAPRAGQWSGAPTTQVPYAPQPNFVERYKEGQQRAIKDAQGKAMTHKLSYAEVDGKYIVYPNVQPRDYDNPNSPLQDYEDNSWTALNRAMQHNDFMEFTTEAEAREYTEHYKDAGREGALLNTKGSALSFMPIEQGEDTKARYDAERRAVGGQGGQVETMRSDIDSRLQEAYQRDLDNYGSELDKGGFWARMGRSMQAAEGNNPAANAVPSQLSDDTRDYQAAKHALDNSQKMIDEANAASRNGNFFAGAGRGMRDKFFDVSTWDFGITDLTDQAAIMRALEAYDKGEQLTESQQALLDAKAVELATTAYFGSELGRGYKAGQVTAEAIPFMFEMAINPAAGIGKGASKAMVRYALKKFGKEAIEKGGKRYIAKQAMKYGTRIVGDVVGASGMAATTGAARTAADALDRMAGNLHYGTDEQGNITFDGHTDAESWVKAFGKAFASTTIENYSEMLGNYFGPALGLLGKGASKVGKGITRTKAGAAVGRGIDKIGGAIETAYNSTLSKKIGLQAVGDFISKVPAGKVAGFLSELEKRAQWHGVMGEYAEEVAGGILNALVVGDQTLDTDKDTGVFNLDNNIDTFLGVALMGGFLSGAKTVGYGRERAHNARQFNKANRMGAAAFGDGWADVQAAIESDPKAGVAAVLKDRLSTKEQREAALRYAAAVTARQGMEQGKAKRDAEGIQTMQEAAAEQSYNTGYEDATTDELRSDINMAYTDARAKLVGLIGEDAVNEIDNDPQAMQAQYDQDMTVDDNTKSAIADYVSAKSAWDGVQQRISDDAADRADQRRAEGERMAYKGKGDMQGAIRPLTINEESKEEVVNPQTGEKERKKKVVYLVNGNIAIEPNGNGLSREGTDKTIYVYDPETGDTHELDPFAGAGVLSVGDVVSMEDYLADNEQQSQAEVQQAAETAQGKVKVNTPFETPQGRKGVVQSIEGDNAIVLFADGEMEQASMPLAEVQQYADALRRKEYEARHPQQTAAEQPQQPNTATEGQAPTAQAETPTEGGNATTDTRTPAQRTYDDVVAKLGADRASKKIDATAKVKADRLTKAQKALKTAQETADNTEYGSKEEQKAEEAVVKAQAEYDAAQQDMAAWDEVRKLRDQALLAQSDAEEAARKADNEARMAAERRAQEQREKMAEEERERQRVARQKAKETEAALAASATVGQRSTAETVPDGRPAASKLAAVREELAGDPEALAMLEGMEPHTLDEVAAMMMATGSGLKLQMEDEMQDGVRMRGFRTATGYSRGDAKQYPFAFATRENGGISFDEFGERVLEVARDEGVMFDESDAMAGVNAALDMFSRVKTQGDINDYILDNRIAAARAYHERMQNEVAGRIREAYGMTDEEYNSYMSWMEDTAEQRQNTLTDEQALELINQAIQQENGRQAETNAGNSEQQSTETTERTESVEAGAGQDGERGNGETDTGAAEVNPANAPTEEEYAEIKAYLDEHPNASVSELQRKLKLGYNMATLGKQRWESERAAQGATAQDTAPTAQDTAQDTAQAIAAAEQTEGTAEGEERDYNKPLKSLAGVKRFMEEIGYNGSLSKTITAKDGRKFVKYEASGTITPNIYFGETTPREILQQFHLYDNIMGVNIPADIETEFEQEDADRKESKKKYWANEREKAKDLLTQANIPFVDVIDSERGIRVVFTDKKNENGNYTEYMDLSDTEQLQEDIESVRAKAESYKQPKQEQKAEKEEATEQPRAAVGEKEEQSGKAVSAVLESTEKIEDFGEKIGMARKDTATKGIKRGVGEMPAWKKKYRRENVTPEELQALQSGKLSFSQLLSSPAHMVQTAFDPTKPFVGFYVEEPKTRWGSIRYYPIKDAERNIVAFNTEAEYEAALPVFEVRDQGYRVVEKDGKYKIVRRASNGKQVEYAEFDTREDAEAYMVTPEGATSLLNRKRENFELPALEGLTRNGMKDWRKGRNITSDDMLQTFGFRGGEFGNWLNAEERQQFLNTAYDALMDLAEALGVSPRALSLGGALSIAFGARGRQGARAHYEPSRAVINLTKMKGAGSLAHEWAHALDNYFGMLKANKEREHGGENDKWVTSGEWSRNPQIRKEIDAIFSEIVQAMKHKTVTRQIDIDKAQADVDKKRASFEREVKAARANYERGVTKYVYNRKTKQREQQTIKPTEQQLAEFDRIMAEVTQNPQWGWDEKKQGYRLGGELGKQFYDLVHDVMPNTKTAYGPAHNAFYFADKLAKAEAYLEKAKQGESETVRIKTDFLEGAEKADKGRAGSYYTKDLEMFARAFETYLANKMAASGRSSDYLTYKKGGIFKALYGFTPYPEGEELNTLTTLFDKLFSTMQEYTDENGNVALYEKVDGKAARVSAKERKLRDAVVDMLRKAGIEVVTESEEGQRVLDMANGRERQHRVYHGSGADFERFDHSHMGEGEGAQSFGWGTYVTEVEGIGRRYARAMGQPTYQGRKYNDIRDYWNGDGDTQFVILQLLRYLEREPSRTLQEAIDFTDKVYELRIARYNGQNEDIRRRTILNSLSKDDFNTSSTLYTVEIPEDNGSNYLDWTKTIPKSDRRRIADAVRGLEGEPTQSTKYANYTGGWGQLADMIERNQWAFQEVRDRLLEAFGGRIADDKKVSELMHSAGFVGIKYPAEYYSGGRSDGAKNYVIFDEGDLQITDKVKFFRTESGEAYGFTMGGKIYLDPKIATAETPIHEYTHLWAAALRAANPKAWERLKSELEKDKDLMAYVQRLYPELKGDELMDEVFAHFSGRRGAERMRAEQERMEGETRSIVGKAKVIAMFENLRNALKKFWNAARELFAGKGVKNESAEDFADMVLADLVGGYKPDRVDRVDRNDRERDAEYMEAVNSGDMEKAQRMVNEAAKRAMPDTKVVDENGNPLVVYHGAYDGGFSIFDKSKRGSATNAKSAKKGFFFTDNRKLGEEYARRSANGKLYEVYLDMKNPLIVDFKGERVDADSELVKLINKAKREGYDGVIAKNLKDGFETNNQYIVFEPTQIKSADPVTYDDNGNMIPLSQRFNERNADIRYQRGATDSDVRFRGEEEPVFYSNAMRAVESIKQERATPEQWVKMIEKQGGLKAGEDKWLGLSEWLKGSDAKTLTKGEVLDYIRANEIQVEEVEYGNSLFTPTIKASLEREIANGKEEGKTVEEVLQEWDEMASDMKPKVTMMDAYKNGVFNVDDEGRITNVPVLNSINSTRLSYTTEGLDNKREIVLTVPNVEPYNESDDIHFGDAGGGRAVAWVRFGETTDKDGKRVLVIDEIQSKRHQDGREKGYDNSKRINEIKKRREELDNKIRNGEDLTDAEYEELEMLAKEQRELMSSNAVPDAPFDKNWHEVAMKRMLRFAAENGYDKVAWTKGEQQAERYDLSDKVDEIKVTGGIDNIFTVTGIKDGETIVRKDAEGEKGLADLIGKDMARKAYSNLKEGKEDYLNEDGAVSFTGENLAIGGEGMKGFYDQILPRFMDKYGKRWGVKTGEVELPNIGDNGLTMWSVDVTDDMRESVMRGQPLFRPKTQSREGGEDAAQGDWYDRNSVERIGAFAGYTPKRIAAMNARQEESARKQFNDAAEKLHLGDRITFVDTIDEIEGIDERTREARRRKKGWYDPRTGKIVIILGNHRSMDDVMKSILHEGVAHHGLRQLFGEHFNTFLDNVYRAASPEIRERIYAMAKKHGWDFRTATEEYLATLAEDTEFEKPENQSWWKQVKAWFIDLLHKIGFKLHDAYDTITDNELRYILWRSYENLVNPGRYNSVVEEAKDIAKQYALKVGEWDETWTVTAETEPNATMEYNGRRVPIWATNGRRGNRADRVERTDRMGSDYNVAADGVAEDNIRSRDKKSGARYDREGNPIGDGTYHVEHEVEEFEEYPQVKSSVQKSATTESVYVTYRNTDNDKTITVRFSDHGNNATRFGDQLDGRLATRDEILYHLGLRKRKFVPQKEAIIPNRTVSKKDLQNKTYPESGLTMQQMYDKVWKGESIAGEVGKLAKGTNYLILGDGSLREVTRKDAFGQTVRIGDYEYTNPADGVLFRDGEDEETGAPKPQARGAYERMVSSAASQWKEAMQDSMLSLKKLYQAVSQAYKGSTKGGYRIEDEKGYENAYLAENRMHSMSEAQIHAYQQDYMKPLQRAIHALTGGKREAYETLTDYMMAKHGLERNEVMAKRDAKKAWEKEHEAEKKDPNYEAARDAAFANIDAGVDDLYLKYRKQDYAGLTALTGKTGQYEAIKAERLKALQEVEEKHRKGELDTSAYIKEKVRINGEARAKTAKLVEEAEKEAQRMVDEYEKQHDTTDLWKATNRATKASLFKMLECGMLSPERHADIRDMFQYYIPLQGFDSDVAEDVYAYMGSDGTAMYGTTIRAAKGRKSKADDPIATIAMNGEAAIRRGNRNLMKQHFLRFVQSHPSDLVSINDVWLRKNANGEWEQYFDADLKETDTPEEVARKVRDFNERMEQEAAANPDLYKRSRELPNVPFRVLNVRDMEQHQVMVQVDGKNYMLTINGNPRAAQALNGLTNPDVFTEGAFGSIMNATQSVVRTLSQFYTTRNPNFVLSNFLRDAVYTNSMVLAKESPNYALAFHKNFLLLPNERMGVLFASWENGKLREKLANGTASNMEKMFYDFMMNGGETGWTSLRDIEKHKRDLQKALKREGNIAASALKKLGDFFDITNRMIENHARFTAYVTSIEMGRSVERAVWDAKEISVNFNKKGAGDKFLKAKNQTFVGKVGAFVSGLGRGNYAFWNASLQGLNNIARIGKRNPAKFMAVATTLMGLGVAIPLLNALLGGDDDDDKNAYWNLPEYVRRSNICFRFTKDMPWIAIPLPIEFRAVYGLGELGSGVALGKEHYSKGDLTKQVAAQFSQVLPLDFMEGGGGWHCLYPTYIKPVIEAYRNQSWTGLPIYRKNTYGQYDVAPEWQRAYSNTNNQIMAATKWLNEATGGDEVQGGNIDFNPARIEYMLRGYLGGYFTVADQVIKMGETATGNREFEWRNMMLANRVVKEGDERTEARKLTNEYFDLKEEYDKTDKSLKAYKKKQDEGTLSVVGQAHYIALMNDSEEYGRYLVFGTYKPLFDAYYKQIKEANAAGDSEEAKRLERGQNELRREMVNIIHDMENGGTFDRKKVATGINENLKKMQNDKLWDAQDKAIDKSIEANKALSPTDNVEE